MIDRLDHKARVLHDMKQAWYFLFSIAQEADCDANDVSLEVFKKTVSVLLHGLEDPSVFAEDLSLLSIWQERIASPLSVHFLYAIEIRLSCEDFYGARQWIDKFQALIPLDRHLIEKNTDHYAVAFSLSYNKWIRLMQAEYQYVEFQLSRHCYPLMRKKMAGWKACHDQLAQKFFERCGASIVTHAHALCRDTLSALQNALRCMKQENLVLLSSFLERRDDLTLFLADVLLISKKTELKAQLDKMHSDVRMEIHYFLSEIYESADAENFELAESKLFFLNKMTHLLNHHAIAISQNGHGSLLAHMDAKVTQVVEQYREKSMEYYEYAQPQIALDKFYRLRRYHSRYSFACEALYGHVFSGVMPYIVDPFDHFKKVEALCDIATIRDVNALLEERGLEWQEVPEAIKQKELQIAALEACGDTQSKPALLLRQASLDHLRVIENVLRQQSQNTVSVEKSLLSTESAARTYLRTNGLTEESIPCEIKKKKKELSALCERGKDRSPRAVLLRAELLELERVASTLLVGNRSDSETILLSSSSGSSVVLPLLSGFAIQSDRAVQDSLGSLNIPSQENLLTKKQLSSISVIGNGLFAVKLKATPTFGAVKSIAVSEPSELQQVLARQKVKLDQAKLAAPP